MTLSLLAAVLATACQDGPTQPTSFEDPAPGVITEASLDVAASEVNQERDRLMDVAEADRVRDGRGPRIDRVGLVVELGGTAVKLAGRILDQRGEDREQTRLLEQAKEYLRLAEAALAAGQPTRAVHFAVQACWTALKAVVVPGGISEEEIRFIHELASELLEDAYASVGEDGSELEKLLLQWATNFYVVGAEQVESGQVRGVAALWKAAVISAYILA